MVYKFPQLNREEIEEMLGLSELKQTRVYQEARAEGRQEGMQEEGATLILRLLARRLGQVAPKVRSPLGLRFAIADPAASRRAVGRVR